MTHNIVTADTDLLFYDLVELSAREFVSPADFKRIGRLRKIVAARTGMTAPSLDAAVAREISDLGL